MLRQASSSSKDPNKIIFLLGNLYLKTGDYGRALVYYRQLALHEKLLSRTLGAHMQFNMGLCHFYRGNYKQAESHFRKTKKVDPMFPKINESLGELLLRREAFSESIVVLDEVELELSASLTAPRMDEDSMAEMVISQSSFHTQNLVG